MKSDVVKPPGEEVDFGWPCLVAVWVDEESSMLVMVLAGSFMLSIRGGDVPDILIFPIAFVERQVCIIGSRGAYCLNKVSKWFSS